MSDVRDGLRVLAAWLVLLLCGWVSDALLPSPEREAAGVAS